MKPKVLVIYDDLQVCRVIRDLLQEQYELEISTSLMVHKALNDFLNQTYDLVIIDVLIPDIDGLTVLSTMHRAKAAPILALSRGASPEDKARAMKLGADTCVDVPFHSEEFLAQVEALLRRVPEGCGHGASYMLSFDMGLIIDPQYRSVMMKGCEVPLTRKEFDILYYLAKAPNQIRTKEQIYIYAWSDDSFYDIGGLVKYHVSKLRRKIDPDRIGYIESIRSIGYRFRPGAGRH